MVSATVCLTVMPLFLYITDVSTVGYSRPQPLFHVVQYGDSAVGRELNLDENYPVEPTPFWTAMASDNKD